MPDLQHGIVAFRCSLAAHANTRRRRVIEGRKLALEAGQAEDILAILILSVTTGESVQGTTELPVGTLRKRKHVRKAR